MHRVTEQRWAGFFWILLSAALMFQTIAFVSPAWLKIFINFEKYYVTADKKPAKSVDGSLDASNVSLLSNYTTANTSDSYNMTSLTSTIVTTPTASTKALLKVPVNQDFATTFLSNDTTANTSDSYSMRSLASTMSLASTITTTPTASTKAPLKVPVNQDYALWYFTQCHVDTWQCDTLTYYHIAFMDESYDLTKFKQPDHWFLDRTNMFLNGAELRFDYSTISESQGEFVFGMIVCLVAWWQAYKQRKRLRKKSIEKLTNTRLIVAAVASFFSGLFVLIPVGRFGNMGDKLRMLARDYPHDIAVHKPIGLAFGAAGGTLALFTGLVIALRLVLRSYCPDCVDVEQQDEMAMTERGNQVDGVEKK